MEVEKKGIASEEMHIVEKQDTGGNWILKTGFRILLSIAD